MWITSDSGLALEVLEILEREAVLLIDGNDPIDKVRAAESLGYSVFCDAIHI